MTTRQQIVRSACVLAALIAAAPPASAQPRTTDLSAAEVVSCRANQEVHLRGKRIETPGDGVVVQGNCEVVIIDSHIVAGERAVRASGNGEVRIEYSIIEGADTALRASGNAEITLSNSVAIGELSSSGNAEILDGGGNRFEGGAPDGAVSDQRSSVGGIDLGGIQIDANGVRVGDVVVDESGVRAGGAHVTAGADGNVVIGTPGAQVVVDGDYVRIGSGGSVVEVTGDWRTAVRTDYDTSRVLVDLGAVQVDEGWQLNLAGDVLFDFDSAAVRPDAAEQLRQVAHVLRERAAGEVIVIGHTDSVGEEAYNQRLSEERAVSVMHWLNREQSIPIGMMKGRGMGEREPIAHNTTPNGSDNPAGRAQNRRVEIRFGSR